mmetsp:Transcript_33335/g.105638  ORF Transcript_33335/g.105638 Transcript_33335/m.105638 type:complete len:296 (-) Transcript_33335:2184-3071(-)
MRKATSFVSLKWYAARVALRLTVQVRTSGAPLLGSSPAALTARYSIGEPGSPTCRSGSEGIFFNKPPCMLSPNGESNCLCRPKGPPPSSRSSWESRLKPVPRDMLLVSKFISSVQCGSRSPNAWPSQRSCSEPQEGEPSLLLPSGGSKNLCTVTKMSSSRIRKSPTQRTSVSPLSQHEDLSLPSSEQICQSSLSNCKALPTPVGFTLTQSFSTTTSAGAESKGPAHRWMRRSLDCTAAWSPCVFWYNQDTEESISTTFDPGVRAAKYSMISFTGPSHSVSRCSTQLCHSSSPGSR